MTTLHSAPRVKFTYGNRPSRLQALTIQDEDSDSDSHGSDHDQAHQPAKNKNEPLEAERVTKSHKTPHATKPHPKQKHQPERQETIDLSKKRKRPPRESHHVETTRRVSDRLKSNSTQQLAQTASSCSQPSNNHNREATPVDHDLLLLLQVHKPHTSQTRSNPARPISQSSHLIKKAHLSTQSSSPRRGVNKRARTKSNGEQDLKSLSSTEAHPRQITRTASQKSLVLSQPTQPTPQPLHSELNPAADPHESHHALPPSKLPHQSPQPHESNTPGDSDVLAILDSSIHHDTESASLNSSPKKLSDTRDDYDVFTILGSSKHGHDSEGASLNPSPPKSSDTPDDSDLFAILGSSKHGHDSEGASLNPSPKKTRVALMGGKTTSQSGAVPSSGSTGCFQPASSIARPANRLLNRVVSSSSGSDLFGPSTQTSTLTPRKALARQLSSDFPPIPVNHEVINTSNLVSLIPAGNAIKKTYGGVRTFKQDESELKVLLPLSTPAPPRSSKRLSATPAGSSRFMGSLKRFQSRETYSELRKKWGVDEDDEPLEAQADLQTIIHQRASGSSKRFTDELLYLIEGLVTRADPPDISTKRSSAVLLIQKLKEQRFLEELRSNGLIERFYNSLREAGAGDGDPILDHALLIFISVLCCQDQKFIEPVLRIIPKGSTEVFSMQSDCLQLLGSVAGRDYSQATLKERSNARRRSSLISQIREVVEESVLRKHFSGVSSPGLLALFSLSRIAMFVPRPGLLPQRSIVHCSAFASVIECLKVYGDKLGHQFDDFVSHHEDFSIADGQDILKHAGYCMDVIEACTVCEEDALNSINLCRQSLSSVFGSLISRCHSLARHDRSEISMSALDILIGCLRTMVNVTNYNPTWASELSTPSVLQALCGLFGICREGFNHHRSTQNSDPRLDPLSIVNQPHHTSLPSLDHRVNDVVFDLLCVDLGLLANLVEQSTEATDMLRETQWVQESDLPAALTRKNRKGHPNRIGGFEELIKLYIDPPCEKLDEKKFIRGSISVLINLSLLNGYDDQLSDLDDAYQSLNELEIIQSFNRILKQVESDSGHRQEEHGQEGHERKDSREANGQSLDADGELESGKLLTKNEIIKSFMTDLKLHSGSASFSLAQPDRNPTLNPPSTAGAHAIERNPNGGEHFQILSSCWNRLRVELI